MTQGVSRRTDAAPATTMQPGAPPAGGRAAAPRRFRVRGQILPLFALSIMVFMMLVALVVDVSWYWANSLRAQRAADAAALAGVVWLPGDTTTAYSEAIAEATKNGFVNGANGTVVTPTVDPTNNRRLRVTVSGNVGTFFMRIVGINSLPVTRKAKAEYVLPVPMGSPQNYYGVGQFLGTTKTPHVTNNNVADNTRGDDYSTHAVTSPAGTWTNPTWADNNNNNSYATSGTTANNAQQWDTFGLLAGTGAIPNDPTLVIDGLQVSMRDILQGSGTPTTSCQLKLELSWDGGTSWSTAQTTTALSTTERQDQYGASNSVAAWGSHTWTRANFSDTNFRARLTFLKPNCGSSRSAGVDTLVVQVWYHTVTTSTTYTYDENASPTDINDPVSGSALAPQNFWGAIFTKGGVRQNGDYFAPATIGGSASGVYSPTTGPSPTYDASGYDYTVDFTGSSGGQVRLYDPIFCATGPNTTSGWYGAGDHWTTKGSTGTTVMAPVAVTYRLYDTKGTLLDTTDDTLVPGATLAYDPAGNTLGDFGGSVGNPTTVQNYNNTDKQDCATNAAHNQWVTLASGLGSGIYRVNVETSSQAANATVGAENMFSIWVKASGGEARVYGGGRMAGYTQVGAAPQSFFLAQIEQTHAGKTLEIKLFDPGDVSGNARLYILSPDGGSYNNATFSYQADAACNSSRSDACSATGRQYIQTAVSGSSSFDNSLITITIPLPASYGTGGLTPSDPGNPNGEPGWWKIYYDVTNANDTTTWQVDIRGNPVHLVVP